MTHRTLTGLMTLLIHSFLSGCASETAKTSVLISDGCVVYMEGVSTRQANELFRSWDVDPKCQIEVNLTTEDSP